MRHTLASRTVDDETNTIMRLIIDTDHSLCNYIIVIIMVSVINLNYECIQVSKNQA
jgi:hypothetical protein